MAPAKKKPAEKPADPVTADPAEAGSDDTAAMLAGFDQAEAPLAPTPALDDVTVYAALGEPNAAETDAMGVFEDAVDGGDDQARDPLAGTPSLEERTDNSVEAG
jgi:hypothetical protein